MNITWLGQGGFVFESAGRRLVVDPYLSDVVERRQGLTRLMAPPLSALELDPEVLLCTHDHLDHLDPEGAAWIAEAHPACEFLGPASVLRKLDELGIAAGRRREIAEGQTVDAAGLAVTAVPAWHSDPDAVGLIVRGAGAGVYLSADTEYRAELPGRVCELAGGSIDAALLCINGRMGNMTAAEAVSVAAALRPGLTCPMHYGLFAENTADPGPFVAAVREAGLDARELQPGEPLAVGEER